MSDQVKIEITEVCLRREKEKVTVSIKANGANHTVVETTIENLLALKSDAMVVAFHNFFEADHWKALAK